MSTVDPDQLKRFSYHVFTKLEGAVTAGMIHLGDRLGLYSAMAAADRPLTSAELAGTTELDERWVREWLHNQAAAQLVTYDGERFGLTPEGVALLADEHHPAYGMGMFHRLPQTMESLERLPESFRSGLGHNYDSHGPEGAVGIERSFGPWNNTFFVPLVLPAMDDVVAKLEAGAAVADVGCGTGRAIILMAEAFPASRFEGYDISQHALDMAADRLARSGVTNAAFHDARERGLPQDGSLDLVTTMDCIHDMTHPAEMIADIRASLRDDGTWLLVDIKARDTPAENIEKHPLGALMYGMSVMSCMSSALSEPGGAGLGTLGLPESKARELATAAGFTRFRKLPIDHAANSFFEIRP